MNDTASAPLVLTAIADGIGRLTLNRPDTLNALNPPMMGCVRDAMMALEADPQARAILITGAGKGFSAGGDLAFLDEMTRASPVEIRNTVYAYFAGAIKAIKLCPKPTVAAVNGPAVGAGFEIALACDFRIASTTAMFRQSWIDLGLISPLGGMSLLPRLVGLAKASEIMMLGEAVDGEQAARIGLVNKTVAPEALDAEAGALAARLAAGPPLGLAAMKEGLRRGQELPLAAEWEHNVYVQALLINSNDFAEGVAAMKERRPPNYSGN